MTILMFLSCASFVHAQDFKFIEVKVLDEQGQPMPDVSVEVKMDGLSFPMSTDELGMISLNVSGGNNPVELDIRHQGYELRKVRWRRGKNVPAEYTFNMVEGKPGQGWVFDAQGKPVAGAEIFTAPPEESLTFLNGRNPRKSKQKSVISDEQGKFTLPFQLEGSTIACICDAGWAQFAKKKGQANDQLEIELSQWASVELLTNLRAQQPGGDKVGLSYISALPKDRGKVEWKYEGTTTEQGVFSCKRAIPGRVLAYRELPITHELGQPPIDTRSHGLISDLSAGGLSQFLIGGGANKVAGKLNLPADYPGEATWQRGYVALAENNPVDLVLRTAIFEYGKLLSQSNVYRPEQRVPPSGIPNYLVRYLAPIQSDGSFEIVGVPPGQYKFSAHVIAQPKLDRATSDILTVAGIPCTVAQVAGQAEQTVDKTIDLGEHILEHTDSFVKTRR